jgi:hypothetical protein
MSQLITTARPGWYVHPQRRQQVCRISKGATMGVISREAVHTEVADLPDRAVR